MNVSKLQGVWWKWRSPLRGLLSVYGVCLSVMAVAAHSTASTPPGWRQLPAYPNERGVAGVAAGEHGGVVIAAGGANFPDAPPWEGGKKKTYDEIYVYLPQENAWKPAGRLPAPRAYAAVLSLPAGVLVLGGENAQQVFDDSLWLKWKDGKVVVEPGPALPTATTSPAATLLGEAVYLAQGYAAGTPRLSQTGFWRIDFSASSPMWEQLPSWNGPSRGQAVMASLDGEVYLLSGLEIKLGEDGKPSPRYLSDAYCYRPNRGWVQIPDLPRSAIAAPTPAPVKAGRIFVLGGVDGRKVGKQPRDTRVPDDILSYSPADQTWSVQPERWPSSVVTAPAFKRNDEWIIVSGETMAGVRTADVWAWKP